MKKIIVFLSFLLFLKISYSQSGWVWQNPYVTGNHLNDVFFTNSYTAFVVGDAGMILRTTNSGNNWCMIENLISGALLKIYFVNEKTGYIVGGQDIYSGGLILHTSDAGITWYEQQGPMNCDLGVLYSVQFVNGNIGYAAGQGTIIKTTNGGSNWFCPSTIDPSNNKFLGVHFVDENTGILTGVCTTYVDWSTSPQEKGFYCRTTNGGISWVEDTLPDTKNLSSVEFNTHDNGFILGDQGKLFHTTDCGISWAIIPSDCTGDLTDISFDGVKNGMIVSSIGWILLTTDSGFNWNVRNNVSQAIKGVSLKSDRCIITGQWGLLRHSTDTGAKWINHHNGILPLFESDIFYGIVQFDYKTELLVGDYAYFSRIFHTTNSGLNWDYQYSPYGVDHISRIKFTDQNTGYIVGSGGWVGKTTNGGLNWSSIQVHIPGSPLFGIFFHNSFTGYVAGEYGYVYKTTDAGENWTMLYNSDTNIFRAIHFVNSKTGWAVGDGHGGSIIRTTNAGLNWYSQSTGLSTYTSYTGIYFINAATGIIAHRDGNIFRTTNGGDNWVTVYNSYYSLRDISFKDSTNGIVVGGPNGLILRTTDSGLNWFRESSYTQNELYSCTYSNDFGATALGEYSTVLRDFSIPVGVKRMYDIIPKSFFLSQNYPNPFNPTTKIKFEIPLSPLSERGVGGFVTLKIYDLLGRVVATLVNEHLKLGTYEVEFDGTNYTSGVYFYKLTAGDHSETKKMVLLK
jgi:photosystem II stability/assembly factor-like uncharacterized protein